MALIEWNDSLSVGISNIDQQHQRLIGMINDLHQAMKLGRTKEMMATILQGLVQYSQEHFISEEKLFIKYDYPLKSKHADEHDQFIEKVVGFRRSFEKGQGTLDINIFNFLNSWFLSHIKSTDQAYAPFFADKGIK